jgi:hypothetical protein
MKETITIKTITKMKEMIQLFKEVYQEDRKEFWEGILGGVLIVSVSIFLFWFAGTFCYDM